MQEVGRSAWDDFRSLQVTSLEGIATGKQNVIFTLLRVRNTAMRQT